MVQKALAFVSGVLFAVGLGVAQMTQPARVLGFLDFFGHWDPTLMFVMGGAVAVYAAAYRLALRAGRPMTLPERKRIDGRLLAGAALFGAGWGLAGFCPGPAVVGSVTGTASVGAFVIAMAAGMLAHDRLTAASGPR